MGGWIGSGMLARYYPKSPATGKWAALPRTPTVPSSPKGQGADGLDEAPIFSLQYPLL